jgi:uncharacterized lipoprotein YajG
MRLEVYMTKLRGLGVAAVFFAGCAIGGASARFVVPPASAQQAATLTKWEYTCFDVRGAPEVAEIQTKSNAAGLQGWEMSGVYNYVDAYSVWCFKRPKM